MTARDTRIPEVEYRGVARARDPETSPDVAACQKPRPKIILQNQLHAILKRRGPKTHDELIALYLALHKNRPDLYRLHTPQSIRSRVSELETQGRVRATGEKRPSALGRPSHVWAAVK